MIHVGEFTSGVWKDNVFDAIFLFPCPKLGFFRFFDFKTKTNYKITRPRILEPVGNQSEAGITGRVVFDPTNKFDCRAMGRKNPTSHKLSQNLRFIGIQTNENKLVFNSSQRGYNQGIFGFQRHDGEFIQVDELEIQGDIIKLNSIKPLTEKQQFVLDAVKEGLTPTEIAKRMGIRRQSVSKHIELIQKKIDYTKFFENLEEETPESFSDISIQIDEKVAHEIYKRL